MPLVASLERQNRIRRDDDLLARLARQRIVRGAAAIAARRNGGRSLRQRMRGRIRADRQFGGAVGDGAPATSTERIVAATVDRLAFAEAHANVALEANVIAGRELEGVEGGEQTVGLAAVLPLAEDARIGSAAVLIGDQILVLHAVLHRFGDAAARKAAVDGCRWVKIRRNRLDLENLAVYYNITTQHLLAGCTSTCSIRLSPISAELISCPLCVTIFIAQIGGGPVLAIVPAVVSMDTLKPSVTFCSPVW